MTVTPPATTSRPQRRRGARRRRDELILDALEELLAETSLRDLAVEQIAERAGITRTRFYHYYKSKQEAYTAVLRRVTDEILYLYDLPDSWFQRPDDLRPLTAMRKVVRDVVIAWMKHGAVMREGADLWNTLPESRNQWQHLLGELVARMARAIDRERERGIAPPGLPAHELAYSLVWFGERLLFLALIEAPGSQDIDTMVESATSIWMRSIYLSDDPDP